MTVMKMLRPKSKRTRSLMRGKKKLPKGKSRKKRVSPTLQKSLQGKQSEKVASDLLQICKVYKNTSNFNNPDMQPTKF